MSLGGMVAGRAASLLRTLFAGEYGNVGSVDLGAIPECPLLFQPRSVIGTFGQNAAMSNGYPHKTVRKLQEGSYR